MIIEQIYDKPLAHASYAVASKGKVMLVDPGRNPEPYIEWADKHKSKIVAVFETHPHADFVSSHLEFQKRLGAKIYINPRVGVYYDYDSMDHEDTVKIGDMTVKALFTPGHSPDHNSYLIIDKNGKEKAVFTGDSLFIGDVGRPDLRESAGNLKVNRKELAGMMYDTIHNVFDKLPDEVEVYPAHGAGSLCGRNISDELSSTIGEQKENNWAFQLNKKERFIDSFLEDQPFIPKYFPHSVELNRQGAPGMTESIKAAPRLSDEDVLNEDILIIDTRQENAFKEGHLDGAINIQASEADKFETWLGSIVDPGKPFYLLAENQEKLDVAIERTAKIGYERYIQGALIQPSMGLIGSSEIPLKDFKANPDKYTIIDIRNTPEVEAELYFDTAINIPLPELINRINEVPQDKPVVVHCAGGYRSTIGSSILEKEIGHQVKIYDLSNKIESFAKLEAGS